MIKAYKNINGRFKIKGRFFCPMNQYGRLVINPFIFFAVFMATFFFFPNHLVSQTPEEMGIIVMNHLNLRPKPGTDNQPITILKKGVAVKILERDKGWLKVEYKGLVGYVQDNDKYIHVITVSSSDGKENRAKGSESKIDLLKREAEEISRKIVKGEAEIETIRRKEVNIINGLNKIDYSLNQARRRIITNKSSLKNLEKKIKVATKQHKELIKRIEKNEAYASKRLVSLYKMNRLGKLNFLASAESMNSLFQRKRNLELILAHDEFARQNLIKDKANLKQLITELSEKRRKKQSLEAEMKDQVKEISNKRSDRSKLLTKVRDKRSLEIAALNSLKKASDALNQTLQDFTSKSNREETLEMVSSNPIYEYKGLLKMPVKGKIVSLFGTYKDTRLNIKNFRSGIDITAKRGTMIQTVFAGRILYANWFKGYGNMIIIDHGDSYYTVYAHLEELFKSKGNLVNTLEDIGTLGDTGSMTGPKLHFEIRHHGKPLNPTDWLIK